ncbi:uncharacterized protein LOC144862333 [Branchiostoma floridae x Branchiostoma japonicum]
MASRTDGNESWTTRQLIRLTAFCVALLSTFYILLWAMSVRELLQPAFAVPIIKTHSMPTPTAQLAQGSTRVFGNLAAALKVSDADHNLTRDAYPTAQPTGDWVFGNLAPDSSWQFNAEALRKVRNITARRLNLGARLQEHRWGNVTKDTALPIGHYNACAVVGNSGVLLGSRCGAEIDSKDYVIRIDLPVLRGFEKDVGGRTNMTVLNLKTPKRLVESSHFKNRSQDVYESRLQDVKDSVLLADHRSSRRDDWNFPTFPT